ncbi:hypothetical protein CRENBAI_022544 [Crenichthys baileyi]|uniref:Uncharacterized protein n=1 Tax=Crenichthys baileyi TaxID=28760 RepID=A0AAV9S3I4_9TELE
MFLPVALAFIWILMLLWRNKTTTVAMPGKREDSVEKDISTARGCSHASKPSLSAPAPKSKCNDGNNHLASCESAGLSVKGAESDPLQASPKVNSAQAPLPQTPQKPSNTIPPMLSSRSEPRERLKFILGASEDNSSDEEVLVTKPPSGASQPLVSASRSATDQASAAVSPPSSSVLK